MKLENPKTLNFYTSSKIHKKGNPGRPVVNSINSHTSNLYKFVDHYLEPHVQNLPSYVKGTPDVIKKSKRHTRRHRGYNISFYGILIWNIYGIYGICNINFFLFSFYFVLFSTKTQYKFENLKFGFILKWVFKWSLKCQQFKQIS